MFNFLRRPRAAALPPPSEERRAPRSTTAPEHILAWYVAPNGSVAPLKSVGGGIDFQTAVSRDKGLRPYESDYALAYSITEWVYRCVEIVTTKVGELLNACQVHDQRTGKVVETHPYLQGVERAFRFYRQDIYAEWIRALLIFGENYTEKVPALENDAPFTLRWLNPLAIEPFVPRGRIERFDYYGDDGRRIEFKPYQITYHYTRNYFDDLRGLSPMRRALQAVNLDMHYQKAYDSFYTNGAQPGLIISPKEGLTPADWDKFQTYIKEKLKGVVNAYKTLTPNFAVDVTTVEIPAPMYSEDLRDDQKERIAAVFGVPVGMVTFGDAKYQLSPEQRKSFYEETVIPRAKEILRVVNADTLRFFDAHNSVELVLDTTPISAIIEDIEAKQRVVLADYHGGLATFNQAQAQRNLPPIAGGDFYLFPSDKVIVPVAQLAQASALVQAQTPGVSLPTAPILPDGANGYHEPIAIEPTIEAQIQEARAKGFILMPKHRDVESELGAWERAALQTGLNKARRFVTYYTPLAIVENLKSALTGELDKPALKALFHTALEQWHNTKAIQATRLDFENEFNAILESAREDETTRRRFATLLRSILRKYARFAYRDGLIDGGIEDGTLDDEDESALALFVSGQSAYVTAFGEKLFVDEGISDVQAEAKAEIWWGKSVKPAYDLGLASADKNGLYEFAGEDGEESCAECQLLKGQKHRLSWYARRKYLPPYGEGLTCSDGGQCKHTLVPTRGSRKAYETFVQ